MLTNKVAQSTGQKCVFYIVYKAMMILIFDETDYGFSSLTLGVLTSDDIFWRGVIVNKFLSINPANDPVFDGIFLRFSSFWR